MPSFTSQPWANSGSGLGPPHPLTAWTHTHAHAHAHTHTHTLPHSRVGYRNPVPIWHWYLSNRCVLKNNFQTEKMNVNSSSNNTSPSNLCSNASVRFSHYDLKAQLGKWEHLRSAWMQDLLWQQQVAFHQRAKLNMLKLKCLKLKVSCIHVCNPVVQQKRTL